MFLKELSFLRNGLKSFVIHPSIMRTDFKSTFVFSNNQKLDENSGAGHLLHFNSGGDGFKSSIELTPLQRNSV